MKNLFFIAIIAFLGFSCGNEGIGFNVEKEFPVTIPIQASDIPQPPFGSFDPPAFTESTTYKLDDVKAFSDYTDYLNAVIIQNIYYSIDNVDASEEISVQSMSMTLTANGSTIGTLDVASDLPTGKLTNLSKTAITNLNTTILADVLKSGGTLNADVEFDFGETPPSSFDFDFVFYFDVLIKARDL